MELHEQKTPPRMNYSDSFFASRLETDLGLCGCVKLQTRNPTPAPLWRGHNTTSWPLLQNPSQVFQPRFAFFKSFGHLCLCGAFRNPKLLNSPANSGNAFPDPTLVGFDDVSAASPDGSSVSFRSVGAQISGFVLGEDLNAGVQLKNTRSRFL